MTSSALTKCAVVVFASASLMYASASAQSNKPAEKFIANAINISEVGRTGATAVEISIQRWSPEAERQRLVSTILEKGPEALLKELQNAPKVGYIKTPTSLAYDLRFAHQEPGEDGGRRIVLATDRPIGFWEAANRPRTIDYPFMVIELRVKRDGTGKGKLSIATKITGNKRTNTIELENYASQPVMLTEVRPDK